MVAIISKQKLRTIPALSIREIPPVAVGDPGHSHWWTIAGRPVVHQCSPPLLDLDIDRPPVVIDGNENLKNGLCAWKTLLTSFVHSIHGVEAIVPSLRSNVFPCRDLTYDLLLQNISAKLKLIMKTINKTKLGAVIFFQKMGTFSTLFYMVTGGFDGIAMAIGEMLSSFSTG